jgi:hypothetical protein
MKRDLKAFLLAGLLLSAMSISVAADQRDKHDPPPKDPKVIKTEPKEPKRDNPPRGEQPKRDEHKKPDF